MFETNGQASVFMATVYGGLIVGLLYDALSLVRRVFHGNITLTGAADLAFWIAAAGVLTLSIALAGGDGLRGYTVAGFACGGILYAVGLHHTLMSVVNAIARYIRRVRWRSKKRRAKLEQKMKQQEGLS